MGRGIKSTPSAIVKAGEGAHIARAPEHAVGHEEQAHEDVKHRHGVHISKAVAQCAGGISRVQEQGEQLAAEEEDDDGNG